jgi:hypothetical protein
MPDKRDAQTWDQSEFGLGTGAMDPVRRADRDLTPHEFGMEIFALETDFGGSNLDRPPVETTPVPRLLPGEKETDRDKGEAS